MNKYEYTPETVKKIIKGSGLSNRAFCKATGVGRSDLYRFINGLRKLSDLNKKRIHNFEVRHQPKKSIWVRIVEFIKR